MFGYITGSNLHQAKMIIAEYCLVLKEKSGAINVPYIINDINNNFSLDCHSDDLAIDIDNLCTYLENMKVNSISRDGYYKFRASAKIEDFREAMFDRLSKLVTE